MYSCFMNSNLKFEFKRSFNIVEIVIGILAGVSLIYNLKWLNIFIVNELLTKVVCFIITYYILFLFVVRPFFEEKKDVK